MGLLQKYVNCEQPTRTPMCECVSMRCILYCITTQFLLTTARLICARAVEFEASKGEDQRTTTDHSTMKAAILFLLLQLPFLMGDEAKLHNGVFLINMTCVSDIVMKVQEEDICGNMSAVIKNATITCKQENPQQWGIILQNGILSGIFILIGLFIIFELVQTRRAVRGSQNENDMPISTIQMVYTTS